MKADFKTKREASKAGALAFLNEMEKMHIRIDDTIEVIAMVAAAMCASIPAPMTVDEAIASFLTMFSASLQHLNDDSHETER